MTRYFLWCGVALFVAVPAQAQQTAAPAAKVVFDAWDAVYLNGAKVGYQHTTVEPSERDGQKVFHTTRLMHFSLKRYERVVTQRLAMTTDETAAGKLIGVSLTQYLDKDQKIEQSGRVEGDKLIVRTPSNPDGQTLPWKEGAIGFYGQELLFQTHKVKAGDRFRFIGYELALLTMVEYQVVVKELEEKEVIVAKKDGDDVKGESVRRRLLRAEIKPGKITRGENTIALPRLTVWLDDRLRTVCSESDAPELGGRMSTYRTTRTLAEKEGAAPALMADLGLNSIIRLNRAIERPHQVAEIVYRITIKDDDDAKTTFTRDARQTVENVHDNTFDLRIRSLREPTEVEKPGKISDEYLKSSYFLDSDNEKVREQAAQIVGDEKSAWRKAQRIEKWVYEHMKGDNGINFAPASRVLRDCRGDCRQHAMLAAALCRAAGVPARTAVGLVYAEEERRPMLAFHMWTEVWIAGQWLMLDATLGQGSVGAAHLKIADHSWQDIQTLAPLLPVTRVIGKASIEVVEVK